LRIRAAAELRWSRPADVGLDRDDISFANNSGNASEFVHNGTDDGTDVIALSNDEAIVQRVLAQDTRM
jgi:hypothetical protein